MLTCKLAYCIKHAGKRKQSIFKLKFKKNYLQPDEPGLYKDGFYVSPNGDFTIDKYGNSVDFNIFDFQH